VAALDAAQVAWPLQVRPAAGTESYRSFSDEVEHPEPGEVSFVDAAGQAHARRWTHRQSGLSAVRDATTSVLIVCEAVHGAAAKDAAELARALQEALREAWGGVPRSALLTRDAQFFDL